MDSQTSECARLPNLAHASTSRPHSAHRSKTRPATRVPSRAEYTPRARAVKPATAASSLSESPSSEEAPEPRCLHSAPESYTGPAIQSWCLPTLFSRLQRWLLICLHPASRVLQWAVVSELMLSVALVSSNADNYFHPENLHSVPGALP